MTDNKKCKDSLQNKDFENKCFMRLVSPLRFEKILSIQVIYVLKETKLKLKLPIINLFNMLISVPKRETKIVNSKLP